MNAVDTIIAASPTAISHRVRRTTLLAALLLPAVTGCPGLEHEFAEELDTTGGMTGGGTLDSVTETGEGLDEQLDLALPSSSGSSSAPTDVCSADDPALAVRVQGRFGPDCSIQCVCGELMGIDCGAALDGLYFYVEASSLVVVATCGGACMDGECEDCPPEGWTCPVY